MQVGLILLRTVDNGTKVQVLVDKLNIIPIYILTGKPVLTEIRQRCEELLSYHSSYFIPKIIGISHNDWNDDNEWTLYVTDTVSIAWDKHFRLLKIGYEFKDVYLLPSHILKFIEEYLKGN